MDPTVDTEVSGRVDDTSGVDTKVSGHVDDTSGVGSVDDTPGLILCANGTGRGGEDESIFPLPC